MRVLKLIIISLVVFGVLIFLMSLLFPSTVRVSRAINIGAKREAVQQKIRDLRQWEQWNDMVTAQNFTHLLYTDSSLSSDQIKIRLVHSSADSIQTSWTKRDRVTYGTFHLLQITPDTTVVHWFFDVSAKMYPWEKFSTLVLDDRMGPPMESALVKLKKMVENNQ
jgi:hypothetical protein